MQQEEPPLSEIPPQERKHAPEQGLKLLLEAINAASGILVLPHNDPDPDAIASSVALSELLRRLSGKEVRLAYQGIIGRAENKALVRYLGNPFVRFKPSELLDAAVILVDTQPGTGNNPLPVNIVPAAVIDHHGWNPKTAASPFYHVAPETGSCSTIVTGYWLAAGEELSPQLATALFYGIKTDTRALSRGASRSDVEVYFYLQRLIDVDALTDIEQAQVPVGYFKALASTLQNIRIYNNVLVALLEEASYPDMAAEMADFFMRMEKIKWVICFNVYQRELMISVRTRDPRGQADELVRAIVGSDGTAGGHNMIAGGQIPLRSNQDVKALLETICQRILAYFNFDPHLPPEQLT